MKIIRVKSCDGCPHVDTEDKIGFCKKLDNYVIHYINRKLIPQKCDLEDVVQIITKLQIEKVEEEMKR